MSESTQASLPGIAGARAMKRVRDGSILHSLFVAESDAQKTLPIYKILNTLTTPLCGKEVSSLKLEVLSIIRDMVTDDLLALNWPQAEALSEVIQVYAEKGAHRQEKRPLEDYEFAMRTATWLNSLR